MIIFLLSVALMIAGIALSKAGCPVEYLGRDPKTGALETRRRDPRTGVWTIVRL